MERDPIRFVWRAAPALHVGALALLTLALAAAWIGLDLVRVALDDAIGGRALASSSAAPFLRLAFTPPGRIAEHPLVLFPGVRLDRAALGAVAAAGLAVVAVAIPLFALGLGLIRAAIGARAAAAVRRTVVERVAAARPSGRADIRGMAALAGEGLGQAGAFLGGAVLTPATAGAGIGLAVLYAVSLDWRLGGAMTAALAVVGLLAPRRLEALRDAHDLRRMEGAAVQRALAELGRRLPALRAHGTAVFERDRLHAELILDHGAARSIGRQAGYAAALSAATALLAPAAVLGAGAWWARHGVPAPGAVTAASAAALAGTLAVDRLARWSRGAQEARRLFAEIARTLAVLQAPRQGRSAAAPVSGVLAAEGVSSYDPATGARIAGVDASIIFPAHVALAGDGAGGARVFAALVGGQLDPAAGRLTFGGVEIAAMRPSERARRIAFAGGRTTLLPGSLRQNLLYGCPDPDAPDIEPRLAEAAAAAGLAALIEARGLAGALDPARAPQLAAAVVDARRAVRAALATEGLADFVEPFDPVRYNRHATIAENILFGRPLGDGFGEARLPAHPFMQAILEAEDLTRPLVRMGVSIATSMVEIFADIPDGHPLFDQFSFFSAAERGYFEDLLERRSGRRRGPEPARDRERLIGLAFRYVESRHRLGLLDPQMEARIVAARATFAGLLPESLRPLVELYDPDRLCSAASLQDNLLFGRLAQDRAGAESVVYPVIRRVLRDRGLDPEVFRNGLATPVDPDGAGLSAREVAAVDLVRCLVRRPDVLVVEQAEALADGRTGPFVARLRQALEGRGLVIGFGEAAPALDDAFDVVMRFERGALASVDDRRERAAAAEPAPA